MSFINQYRIFSQNRPWIARTLLVLLVIIITLSLIRISLPFVIKSGATYWFESEDIKANIGDIKISLIDGTFVVNDVSGKNKTGKGFSLDRLDVVWQWKPLFENRVIIDQLEVESLNMDALLFENGDMEIAGLVIKASTGESQPETTEQSTDTPWDVTVKNISFSDTELCLQQYTDSEKTTLDYCGKIARADLAGELSFKPSIQRETTDLPLYVQGALSIDNIALQNNQLELDLLSIESLDLKNINVDTLNTINIDNINIEKVSALQRAAQTSANDAQLFAFDRLNIQPFKLAKLNNLHLGAIELTGSRAYLLINKDGQMDYSQWLPAKQQKKSKASSDPFYFAFDKFILVTRHHFIFVDDSLKETFTADIHDIDFSFTQLDSHAPDSTSHLSLALVIDKHGSLKLETDINPLADRPSIKGTGTIAGFDLRMLAPFSKQHIGHNIKSGQLDADLKLNVNKGVIDSNMGLTLHQFELITLSQEEAEELNTELGFPLNSSLSLLRDRDNKIRLDIPATGDIDNPSFDPRDAIVTASSKALTSAVIHFYTPFGLLYSAGDSLFNLATALHFDPVLFEAGESELSSSHEESLDKLAALMTKRPGIHLTLCGISNHTDRDTLFPEFAKADTPAQEQQETTKAIPKENITTLKQLAESRSSNIKNYLVNQKAVEASRLIECSPEYKADEIAGVEISI